MKSMGRNHGVIRPLLLCIYLNMFLAGCLSGCMRSPDILDQDPVIPLTGSPQEKVKDPFPALHLSGNAEDTQGELRGKNELTEKMSGNYKSTSDNRSDKTVASKTTDDAVKSMKNDGSDYQVEGVQLSEKQLEKMSAYFNLEDVNPYLQQVYLIPEDFDKDADNDPVNITCVAGSYDSNRLYSIFYKKEGSNALWNVVLRRRDPGQNGEDGDPGSPQEAYEIEEDVLTDGNYRFHSNRLLDPNSGETE